MVDTTRPINILGIPGSLRQASYNKAALKAAQELLPAGATLEIFGLDGIPPFSEDDEQAFPPRVVELKARVREADAILIEELSKAGFLGKKAETSQAFVVLLPVRSVGVMGDERSYDYTAAIRAVHSQDGMTADWVKLPYEVLEKISNRIVNEVKGINRVVYDISSKPPATIEWE